MTEPRATGVLVDSDVLLDLFTDDPAWAAWSGARLAEAFDAGHVVINPIVYAEVSVAFDRIEALEDALPEQLGREALPWEAAFLAGKCFVDYRRRGGTRRSPFARFPHRRARCRDRRALLTRDAGRCRSQLPAVTLISP